MKTFTVREAQHNLAEILKAVEAGETVEILRRKTRVARLIPILQHSESEPVWDGHAERMTAIWGDKTLPSLDKTLDELRGER